MSEEYQEKAWQAVLPIVSQLKRYYEFSVSLGRFSVCFVCYNFSYLCCISLFVCSLKWLFADLAFWLLEFNP